MNVSDVNKLQERSYITYSKGNEIHSKDLCLENDSASQNRVSPSATFSDLPTELVSMILNVIPKLYSPKESMQQLSVLMLVNKELFFEAIKVKHRIFFSEFEKLLVDSADIDSQSPEYQMDWCERATSRITQKTEFSYNQTNFGIDFIINKVQHICFDFVFFSSTVNQCNKLMDMVFHALLKKTNIKTLDLPLSSECNYDKYKFTSNFLWVLHKNSELSSIPFFCVDSDEFDIKYIPTLLQLLSGKNIDSFSLGLDKNKRPALNAFSKYLKNINIKEFSADFAGLANGEALHLIENLPEKLKTISLSCNNIDRNGAKNIFKKLQNIDVQYLDLTGNHLSGYKADDLRAISNFLTLETVRLSGCHLDNERHKFSGIKNKHGADIEFLWD